MEREWYIQISDQTRGPLALLAIKTLLAQGNITDDTLVRHSSEESWVPLKTHKGLNERIESEKEQIVAGDKKWHVAIDGRNYGPFAKLAIENMSVSGKITPDTLVWCQGMETWVPMKTIPELYRGPLTPPPIPTQVETDQAEEHSSARRQNSGEKQRLGLKLLGAAGKAAVSIGSGAKTVKKAYDKYSPGAKKKAAEIAGKVGKKVSVTARAAKDKYDERSPEYKEKIKEKTKQLKESVKEKAPVVKQKVIETAKKTKARISSKSSLINDEERQQLESSENELHTERSTDAKQLTEAGKDLKESLNVLKSEAEVTLGEQHQHEDSEHNINAKKSIFSKFRIIASFLASFISNYVFPRLKSRKAVKFAVIAILVFGAVSWWMSSKNGGNDNIRIPRSKAGQMKMLEKKLSEYLLLHYQLSYGVLGVDKNTIQSLATESLDYIMVCFQDSYFDDNGMMIRPYQGCDALVGFEQYQGPDLAYLLDSSISNWIENTDKTIRMMKNELDKIEAGNVDGIPAGMDWNGSPLLSGEARQRVLESSASTYLGMVIVVNNGNFGQNPDNNASNSGGNRSGGSNASTSRAEATGKQNSQSSKRITGCKQYLKSHKIPRNQEQTRAFISETIEYYDSEIEAAKNTLLEQLDKCLMTMNCECLEKLKKSSIVSEFGECTIRAVNDLETIKKVHPDIYDRNFSGNGYNRHVVDWRLAQYGGEYQNVLRAIDGYIQDCREFIRNNNGKFYD